MAAHPLGLFYEGFSSWRRALAKADSEAQRVVFANACVDVAGFVGKGLDRAAAADELHDMAVSIGWDAPDEVQLMIGREFAKIERKGNGAAAHEDEVDWEALPEPDIDLNRDYEQTNSNSKQTAEIALVDAFPIDVEAIPRRPWLVPGLLLRRQVTLLIAPPGSGKSLLTLQLAMMCAAPLANWGGWRPRQRCRCLVINSEEDSDELKRRLWAAAHLMGIDQQLLRGMVLYADRPHDIVIAEADHRTKTVTRRPMADQLIATIRQYEIDVVIIDPFAETFIGDENSNSELKWAAVLWREIARFTECAVLLVHHTRKSAEHGDMDAARGGGALAGVARIVCTLFGMGKEEAERMLGNNADERSKYLRFDDAKANLTLISSQARWFEKHTEKLGNGLDEMPADEVGVLVPWKPPTALDAMDPQQARRILDDLAFGVRNADGHATGNYFMVWRKGQKPKFWAGDVIMEALGCTAADAKTILGKWLKEGMIETFTAVTPQSRGHHCEGNVRVLNRPGVISHDEV
jgi:hypothetical protein